jgi:antibiotic biosynthesis monooxygenase (ABM) superfamily enzyme
MNNEESQRHAAASQTTAQPASRSDEVAISVVRHRVKPGAGGNYELWLKKIIAIAAGFPGHMGVNVIRPTAGSAEYTVAIHFQSLESAQRWFASPARQELLSEAQDWLEDGDHVQITTGMEFWFDPPGAPRRVRPYKQFLLVLSVIFPLSFLVPWVIDPIVAMTLPLQQPVVHRLLVTSVIVVLMTYVIMPRYSRLLSSWLYRA